MRKENYLLLKRILSYLIPFKKEFLFAGFLLLSSNFIGFLQPMAIRSITDEGMLRQNIRILVLSVIILTLLVLLNQGIDLLQTRLFVIVHNASFYTIFHQTFERLLHLKKSYFEDKNNAEILTYLQVDVSQVSSVTDRYTVFVVSYVFRIFSGLFGLFIISWELALIVLAVVPVKILLVRFLSAQLEKSVDQMIAENRDFSRWFGDNLNGVDEIKLWGLFEKRNEEFRAKQSKVLRLQKRNTMIDAWNSFGQSSLEWSVTILLYLIGGLFVCWGKLTIGAVFAFVSYSGYVTGPVGSLINLKMYFARIMPSAKRLFAFLDMDAEAEGTQNCKVRSPCLEFRNVSFRYEESRPILNGFNFHLDPGEKIAIIGSNGSGKSTIVNLLLRFYEPDGGEILLDGQSIQTYSMDSYRKLFSVVSQEPYLFLGTIEENVNLTKTSESGALEVALQTSGVNEFLSRMPEGAQTQIGQNGARLSGGEKQKMAVARALLKDAPIVILDEATSGFDVESDAYLHNFIVNEMQDKTVLMITHHYSNLEGMDRVYRLEGGKLTEDSDRISLKTL